MEGLYCGGGGAVWSLFQRLKEDEIMVDGGGVPSNPHQQGILRTRHKLWHKGRGRRPRGRLLSGRRRRRVGGEGGEATHALLIRDFRLPGYMDGYVRSAINFPRELFSEQNLLHDCISPKRCRRNVCAFCRACSSRFV